MRRLALLSLLGLLAIVCVPLEASAGSTLSAKEVRALFPGKFEAVWKEKRSLTLSADANGGIVGYVGILSGSGRWWVKGSNLCITFDRWEDEKTRCSRVVRNGGWYHGLYRDSGTPRLRFRPI